MLKVLIAVLAIAGMPRNADASSYPPPPILNDAESFVVARSFKLGNEDSGVASTTNTHVGSNTAQKCVGDNCDEVRGCKTDADCDADQYCAKLDKKSDTGVCKTLCEGGKDKNGNKCSAGDSSTPECGYDDKHQSHCSCTPETCPAAYECNHQSNTYYKCEPCAAGEICNCTDGKEANGRGDCVTCNNDNKCAWDEYCANAGTTSSYCGAVSCASDEYVSNHGCHSCGSHCDSCSNSYSCDSCEDGYVDAGDGSCKPQDCGSGYYFDENTDPHCQPCGSNCATCSSSSSCEVCSTGYELVNGECQSISCDAGYYLSGNDCLPCSSECATCSGSASSCDSCDSDYVWTPYTCTLKGCSDMGYQTSCSAGDEETSAGTAPNGESCVSCSTPSTPTSECTTSSDCASNEECSGGSCTTISCSGTCKEISNHQCVTKSGCCTSDSDCGSGKVCSNNSCVDDTPASECSSDSDCAWNKYCSASGDCVSVSCGTCQEVSSHTCVKKSGCCTSNNDCTGNQVCTNGTCTAPECTKDSECASDKYCSASGSCVKVACSGTCKEISNHQCVDKAGCCTSNSQCDSNEACVSNKCEEQCGCESYEYCKGGKCYLQAGKCYDDNDCKNSDKCSSHSCVPACSPNPCSGTTPDCVTYLTSHKATCVCTPSPNSCGSGYECVNSGGYHCKPVACTSDSDCDTSKKCSNGSCVDPCSPNPCSGTTPDCWVFSHEMSCRCNPSPDTCGTGYKCVNSGGYNCKPVGCTSDSDCDTSKKCSNGSCVDPCSPNPCSGQTPSCSSFSHKYYCSCTSSSCPSGYVCSSGACKMQTTEKCAINDDCSAEKTCVDGYCVFKD